MIVTGIREMMQFTSETQKTKEGKDNNYFEMLFVFRPPR
jgi:hypothetical protein